MTAPQPPDPDCEVPLVELEITDELDLAQLRDVAGVLDSVLSLRPREVVFDLSGCGHIDAASIGFLLDVRRRLARHGAVLTLRNPDRRVRRILDSTGLGRVLRIVYTTEGARSAGEDRLPPGHRPALGGRASVGARRPGPGPLTGHRP
ncbi:STAS domain-containing protein [Micromonospora sp. PLK6-60]|uniref:STAS domain-containing protein n=1 Tax=Micromonospora sp. PLK6-60 TaxID=2873383 RepID=UPI0027E194E1|nr:STAS domain-containing protein [Micromonospora sp. PLK6-60]